MRLTALLHFFVLTIFRPLAILWFGTIRGWQVAALPDDDKYILAGYPHTSNWDSIVMLYAALYNRRRIFWYAKAELFDHRVRGWMIRQLGGVPIDRTKPLKGLRSSLATIKNNERIALLLAPEGTRAYTDGWRRGFHVLARTAQIPVVYARMDFGTRQITFTAPMMASDSFEADLDKIRGFFEGVEALNPEKMSPIRALDEAPARGE